MSWKKCSLKNPNMPLRIMKILTNNFTIYKGKEFPLFRRSCTTLMPKPEKHFKVERLKDRSHMFVYGKDSVSFMQRLMTNDIHQLSSGSRGIYTLMLTPKGVVAHDALVYSYGDHFLLEVDNKAVQGLLIHMKMCQGKLDAEVKNVEEKFSVWAVFSNTEDSSQESQILEDLEGEIGGSEWFSCIDPRLMELGLRVVGPRNSDVSSVLRSLRIPLVQSHHDTHRKLRYKLGVAQGIEEIPYGRFKPLEVNGDFLNAICHDKEHYVGSRETDSRLPIKRVLPLILPRNCDSNLKAQTPIEDLRGRKKTPIGFLCGRHGLQGIGIISIHEALSSEQVRIGRTLATCYRPNWWPDRQNSLGAVNSC